MMQHHANVVRDAAWIEREYGREKWPAVLGNVQAQLGAGEMSLARVVNVVRRLELKTALRDSTTVIIGGRPIVVPWSFSTHGGVGLQLERLVEASLDAEAIVELGSGWGYNLFNIWLRGGAPRARYAALEYTKAGRACTRALRQLEPTMDISVAPFDYYHVDLAGIPAGNGKLLVFTVFGADGIPQIPRDVFDALRQLDRPIECIHFEPVGWQIPTRGNVLGSSIDYATRHDYNRNLWPLLTTLECEGLLTIRDVEPEIFGQNPANAATLIRWTMDG